MFKKENFGKIINFYLNFFLGIGLTSVAQIMTQSLTAESLLMGLVTTMGIGYVIGDLVPAMNWAMKATAKIKSKFLVHIVSMGIVAFVNVALISFFNVFVSAGFHVLSVWVNIFPLFFVLGWVVLIVFMPICQKIAIALTK